MDSDPNPYPALFLIDLQVQDAKKIMFCLNFKTERITVGYVMLVASLILGYQYRDSASPYWALAARILAAAGLVALHLGPGLIAAGFDIPLLVWFDIPALSSRLGRGRFSRGLVGALGIGRPGCGRPGSGRPGSGRPGSERPGSGTGSSQLGNPGSGTGTACH
jgi:hypothetical protein